MKIATFAEIADEFLERVNKAVWCNVATIDTKGRPRSRILHPIWQGEVGWITTRRGSPKERHLQEHPFVSLEGRKYSASRIRLVLTVFGEVPVFPLMPFFPPSLQPTSPLRWTHDQSPHPLQAPAR